MNRLKKAVTGKSSKSSATDAHVADNHVVVHGDGFADAPEVRGRLPPSLALRQAEPDTRLRFSTLSSHRARGIVARCASPPLYPPPVRSMIQTTCTASAPYKGFRRRRCCCTSTRTRREGWASPTRPSWTSSAGARLSGLRGGNWQLQGRNPAPLSGAKRAALLEWGTFKSAEGGSTVSLRCAINGAGTSQ